MRRKRKKEIDDTIPYEYRDITSLPIPLDSQRGMWTKPEVIIVGGLDTDNAVHPLKIYPDGTQMSWPMGTTMEVDGTFTKNAVGTVGEVDVTPATGDEFILMYCGVTRGLAAGGGEALLEIQTSGGDRAHRCGRIASLAQNQAYWYPGLQAYTSNSLNVNTSYMISGTDVLHFQQATMADTEVFHIRLRVRSMLGVAPTVTATAGDWA